MASSKLLCFALGAAYALCLLEAGEVWASSSYTGYTYGSWGSVTPSTAVYTINNQTYTGTGPAAVSSFQFGIPSSGFGQGSIVFTGSGLFTNIAPENPFVLGQISFSNSTLRSAAAGGVTLTLDVNANGSDYFLPISFSINNTTNTADPVASADYLTITSESAHEIGITSVAMSAYEGATVTVDLIGQIVGDPQIEVTGLRLPSNQTVNGFLGTPTDVVKGPFEAVVPIPETRSITLFLTALAAVGLRNFARPTRRVFLSRTPQIVC